MYSCNQLRVTHQHVNWELKGCMCAMCAHIYSLIFAGPKSSFVLKMLEWTATTTTALLVFV